MGAFIGALVIIVMAAYIAYVCKRRIEDTFFIAFALVSFTLYIFGMFGTLKNGVFFVGFMTLWCLIGILHIKLYKDGFVKQKIKALREYVLTPGLIVFIFLAVFFVILNYGREYYLNDEFSHWGLSIKNMFALDNFYCVPESSDTFKDYPPFATLICYFWTAITGTYNESYTFTGMGLLMISCLMPVFKKFSFKDKKTLVYLPLVLTLCFVFTMAFKLSAFTIIAVDTLIALIPIYVFLLYFGEKCVDNAKKDITGFVFISIAAAALTLTKSIAIGFAIFVVVVIAADLLFFDNEIRKGKKTLFILAPVLALALAKVSWSFVLKVSDFVSDGVGAEQTLKKVYEMVFDAEKLSPYRKQTVDAFINATIEGRFPFGMSLLAISLILVLFSVLLVIAVRKNGRKVVKYSVLGLFPVVGLILYLTAILYTYAYRFSEYEATSLASYERYIGTFLTMWLLYLAILYFSEFYGIFEKKFFSEDAKKCFVNGKVFVCASVLSIVLLVVFYMFLYPYSAEFSVKQRVPTNHASQIGEMYGDLKEKDSGIASTDVKICYITTLTDNRDYLIANYNAAPFFLTFDSAWPANIGKYDYLYIDSVTESDKVLLGLMGLDIENTDFCKKIYRVVSADGGYILSEVNRT